MKDYMKCLGMAAMALAMIAAAAAPAGAQQASKQVEVSGGYQYNRAWLNEEDSGCELFGFNCDEDLHGWYADVAGQIKPMWSWVAQVDGAYKKDAFGGDDTLKLHAYGGGIRFSSTVNPKVTPFGQVIAGGLTSSSGGESDTDFALTVGGGVNIPVNDRWGVRGEADYRRVFAKEEEGGRVNILRVVGGVYFTLGR